MVFSTGAVLLAAASFALVFATVLFTACTALFACLKG